MAATKDPFGHDARWQVWLVSGYTFPACGRCYEWFALRGRVAMAESL